MGGGNVECSAMCKIDEGNGKGFRELLQFKIIANHESIQVAPAESGIASQQSFRCLLPVPLCLL